MSKPKLTYNQLIEDHLSILKNLQYDSGLFSASSHDVGTGYNKSWLRDNFYEVMAFEVLEDWDTVEKTYDAIMKIFLKHEEKIDQAIEQKPAYTFQYIHARFNPQTFEEFWEEWGNKQNDAVGAILYNVGKLEQNKPGSIFESADHIRITQKLVNYLQTLEYWHDRDSGMWEEDEEVHASSVGACVGGLREVSKLDQIDVPDWLIHRGIETLGALLPRESERKFADLSELSLIWPYEVVDDQQRDEILENVEYHLMRERGVIRYKGDRYYNSNPDGFSEEAEWTFGLAWLAIIYEKMGDKQRAKSFLDRMIEVDTDKGMPELYYSNSPEFNDNTPLGWTESLFIVALHNLKKSGFRKPD